MENYLGKYANRTNFVLTGHNEKITLNELATNTILALWEFENLQNAIYDTMTDSNHGKVNPLILTPGQISGQMNLIRGKIPKDLTIYGQDGQYLELYKIMTSKVSISGPRIIIEVTFPLIHDEKYQIFNIICIPTHRIGGKYMIIQSNAEFLAASLDRNLYYKLKKIDLDECQISGSSFICRQTSPIIRAKQVESENECEINVLKSVNSLVNCRIQSSPSMTFWRKLTKPKSWIYVLNKNSEINSV